MFVNKHWFKKYEPKQLDQLTHTPQVTDLFRGLAKKSNFPHILIYGPPGSGKYLRAMCFLNEVFGEQVHQILYSEEQIGNQNQDEEYSQSICYSIGKSKFHMQIDVTNLHQRDTIVIQNLIKTKEVEISTAKFAKVPRVLIIRSSSKLSKQAQAALRATMQKQSQNIRLIFICQNIHQLIAPIKSRCLNIRLKSPTQSQIFTILQKVGKSVRCKSTQNKLKQLAELCQGNIRKAINYLQCYEIMLEHTRNPTFPTQNSQNQLNHIVNLMFKQQTVSQSQHIIQKLSNGDLIKKNIRQVPLMLLNKLIKKGMSNGSLKELIGLCAKYEIYFDPAVREYERIAPIMALIEESMLVIHDEQSGIIKQ